MEQGSRVEDGAEVQGEPNVLAWTDRGPTCRVCGVEVAEGLTKIDRALIQAHEPERQEAFVESERARMRLELQAMGDVCESCVERGHG